MSSNRAKNTAERLAQFISHVRRENISPEIRDLAKLHLLDGFATMIGGVGEGASRQILRYVSSLGAKKESSVIGTRIKVSAQQAALVNGVQGHVLDFDDAQLATLPSRPFGQQTHPTSPVLAAALAVAEKMRSSPSALLTSYVIGVEVACRLADAVDPSHYLQGFHPTGTLGTFGATAAAAHLLRLDARKVGSALGIAGTLASGLRANRGTMAKALNAGRAAENGVMAATLAARGFTGTANVFEDPMGFFSAACGNRVDQRLLCFGRPYFFRRPGIAVKLYPCAGVLHPALDVVLDLVRRHDIRFEEVGHIRVTLDASAALPLVYNRPKDGLQARFSLPFAIAVAVVDRHAGLRQFASRRVCDPRVLRLMRQVELSRSASQSSKDTRIEIMLRDGQGYAGRSTMARGHSKLETTRVDIENKFRSCASGTLGPRRIERFLKQFWLLEKSKSLSRWLQALRPPP
jgi:2-methylcitrate dehydratase PrpD